jgi:formamidopyrimidine-DNA glycosylase
MPELPEVEQFKKYIDSTSINKKIINAEITNEKILTNISKNEIEKKLIDSQIIETSRIGKYLFLLLEPRAYLIFHFGMTGNIKYFKNKSEEPSHTRLLIAFSNHYHLAYDCQRLFGFITVTHDKSNYINEKQLGPDALLIKESEFIEQLRKRSIKIKSFLMNQHILSGIGNIYTDEILFQSRIHPNINCNILTNKQRRNLFSNISFVLNTAIEHDARIESYPENFLLLHRRKDNLCPLNKNHELKTIKISGRTTYYCPYHQKKIKII